MVTEHTNTVYNCRRCGEPKQLDSRHGHWIHIRRDSLCDNDGTPQAVRLTVPVRPATALTPELVS